MEEKEFLSYYQWSISVSRLMELIAMTNRTIQIHKEGNDSLLYIKQYEELFEGYKVELNKLMQIMGLSVHLSTLKNTG
ncbi:hypothetical protein EMA8858_03546 [Emticicia aquatica]|uniref:Uncharacterized protein n=2 Tax=Emticicia aquatica TaxID=1681835 RepID=A0ABM9ATX9_9BACT|nr:hypothetical protein EMA8858_03546 [Emticicia aquatica]